MCFDDAHEGEVVEVVEARATDDTDEDCGRGSVSNELQGKLPGRRRTLVAGHCFDDARDKMHMRRRKERHREMPTNVCSLPAAAAAVARCFCSSLLLTRHVG